MKFTLKVFVIMVLIALIVFSISCKNEPDPDPIRSIDTKYCFNNGEWMTYTGGLIFIGDGSTVNVEKTSIRITKNNIAVKEFINAYSNGGSKYFNENQGIYVTWSYLYDTNGKIGIVLDKNGIEVLLGKTCVDDHNIYSDYEFPNSLNTEGMQDEINGMGN